MSDRGEPPRLGSASSGDPVLARLGELFGGVPSARPLPREAIERVRARLSPGRRWFALGVRGRALALVLAAVGLAGVATAGLALSSRFRPAAVGVLPVTAPPAEPPRARAVRSSVSTAPAPVAPPSAESEPRAPANPAPRVSAPPSSTGVRSPLAEESQALEPALAALRRERDAKKALMLIDRYQSLYPHGVLALEARVAEVDANLMLGRRDDALGLLAGLPLERVGRSTELRLVRAELRARSDCAAALGDFDAVLRASPSASFDERALYGRAACRRSLGDAAGADADRDTYLARYPSGRFAEALRR